MDHIALMSDDAYRTYTARKNAAGIYRANGFDTFAQRIECGGEDDCSQVRLMLFALEPAPPLTDEFVAAWHEAALQNRDNHVRGVIA